jgi:peroxiredoxin
MKIKHLLLAALSLCLGTALVRATETNSLNADMQALMMKIHGKLQGGQRQESDFTDELKGFDDLLAKHKDAKPDEAASVLYMKARLYQQVFHNNDKSDEIMKQIEKDYPDSQVAKAVGHEREADKIRAGLKQGAPFPEFSEKDVLGNPVSIASYKGKVLLVDFWATWCGPCVGEVPNVVKTYEDFHPKGFEIVGISLDQDKNKLTTFTKQKNMTWQQYFDGKGWENKLASKYGIQSIPATFLLDRDGKIIAADLRGEALTQAVEKAVAAK